MKLKPSASCKRLIAVFFSVVHQCTKKGEQFLIENMKKWRVLKIQHLRMKISLIAKCSYSNEIHRTISVGAFVLVYLTGLRQ